MNLLLHSRRAVAPLLLATAIVSTGAQEPRRLTQSDSIPMELATALVSAGSVGIDPQILVGAAPGWMTAKVYIAPNARVVGSAFMGTTAVTILSTADLPDAAIATLKRELATRGWKTPPSAPQYGGFRPAGMNMSGMPGADPDVKADEVGGECSLNRTSGNGALFVTAFYPTRAASNTQTSVTFDSAGHVIRYSETRGITHSTRGLTIQQMDSVRRAFDATNRSTAISFDYGADRALAMNRGGGKPTTAITSSVRDMEKLDNLQQPAARMERMRKLCGV
ncbi:MAG TPA: hypothetical protein VGM82_01965 [Gemmatimonadaceae bacterium]|jgi:hypothetical protein